MSLSFNTAASNVLSGVEERRSLASNLFTTDATLTDKLLTALREKAGRTLVELNVAQFPTFPAFLEAFLQAVLALEERPEALNRVPEIPTQDSEDLRRFASRVLSSFARTGCWFCLVLTHFDGTDDVWDDEEFSWMRELIDFNRIPACVVLSENRLNDISEKPVGSSPFHNVFAIHLLEGADS